MGDVLTLTRFAETIPFNRFCQDNGRRTLVIVGGFICIIHLFWIVPAPSQFVELFIGEVFNDFEQARDLTKKCCRIYRPESVPEPVLYL